MLMLSIKLHRLKAHQSAFCRRNTNYGGPHLLSLTVISFSTFLWFIKLPVVLLLLLLYRFSYLLLYFRLVNVTN